MQRKRLHALVLQTPRDCGVQSRRMDLQPVRTASRIRRYLLDGVVAGSCASVLSAVVLALAGRHDVHSAVAPLNAVSHWWWDREALYRHRLDLRHTVLGYVTHHGAAIFWGTLLAVYLNRQPQWQRPAQIAAASAATSAIACFVDFRLTPRRLTPGYEHHLSNKSLAATYAVFAVGLALGSLAVWSHRRRR
jgi:hypothetical protein